MLTCFRCLNTKVLLREITHQIKGVSFKAVKMQRRAKTKRAKEPEPAATVEAKREEEVKEEQEEEEEEEEWVAEAEHGVLITLVSLPNGGNILKKIRFREELFDAWEAERWWRDNCERVMDLYSVRQPGSQSDDDERTNESAAEQEQEKEQQSKLPYTTCNSSSSTHPPAPEISSDVPAEEQSSGRGEREAKDKVVEWVVEDKPGIFVTVRSLPDGTRELPSVEFRLESFGEVRARVWWEENKARLHAQYT